MWTIKKKIIEFVKILLVFCFGFFGHEACGILTPQPGLNPYFLQCKTGVLITGPPGKSLKWQILIPGLPPSPPHPHQQEAFDCCLVVHSRATSETFRAWVPRGTSLNLPKSGDFRPWRSWPNPWPLLAAPFKSGGFWELVACSLYGVPT